MGKFNGKFLSGVIGNLKFSVRNGKQVVSQAVAPGTMKQTEETKKASTVFGKAASLNKLLRQSLVAQYKGLFFNATINSLTGRMSSILKDCKDPESGTYQFDLNSFLRLEQLEFNPKSKVSNLLPATPVATLKNDVLSLTLFEHPLPRDLKFPLKSFKCEITTALSLFRLKDRKMVFRAEAQSIVVEKGKKVSAPHTFLFNLPAGCLCVMTVFLNYWTIDESGWTIIKNRKFSPAVICGAYHTEGNYQAGDDRSWSRVDLKFTD